MKKFLVLLMVATMVLGTMVACGSKDDDASADSDLAYIKDKGVLEIGITNYAPMNYPDDAGEWTGFDTEFAQAVGEKLGVEVNFTEIDWDNKYNELDAKSIDCVWNGMTITEEGKLNASISNPYVKNAQVVVMAKDKLEDYPDAESMKDLKFAVETGSAGEAAVKDAGLENVTAVSTQTDALLEVKSGSADACVIDITMAISMTGEGTSYANLGFKVEMTTEEYGIAMRKDSDLVAEINKIMAELMEDDTLDALAEKYELTLIK
ncbi:polar amino acid transport system substrate-binding protein [Clostridiales Family XIII bacterium PM5-7]